MLAYWMHKVGIDIEFKISVYCGNDNPYSVFWTLMTAKLFSRDDNTTSLIGFNFSNSVNNETIELSAIPRKAFGLEDIVRFEHHVIETWKSIVIQPYDRREELIEVAKRDKILYKDQIFIADAAHYYPSEIALEEIFKNGTKVRFRAIKPSDEEGMRRLFYRFSDEAVYYRYFSPIKTMPHTKMQQYVNVDFRKTMAIVGIVGDQGQGDIIAEARFVQDKHNPHIYDNDQLVVWLKV